MSNWYTPRNAPCGLASEVAPIETLYGDLKGLKTNQLRQLERLYHQRFPGDRLVTIEAAQRWAAIAAEVDRDLCVYLNRRGQVVRVGVGTPHQTRIPPGELPRYGADRLCGLRCVAVAVKGDRAEDDRPPLSALTALTMQRLDALVWLNLSGQGFQRKGGGASGYVGQVYLAHLIPQTLTPESEPARKGLPAEPGSSPAAAVDPAPTNGVTQVQPTSLAALDELDLPTFVGSLEEEFRREALALAVSPAKGDRVLLVGLQTGWMDDREFADRLTELERLVETAGGTIVEIIRQKRARPHPQTVIGEGKVQEVAIAAQTHGANLIAFDCDLSPAQARNLEDLLGVRSLDRTQVILDIFAQRAQSGAGKLQVELAQLEYSLPRLSGRGQAMSRLGGGIGTRGPGETKLETDRRAIQKRIARLQEEVNRLQAHRSRLRQQRQHHEVPSIAIVGYTNAGKSTLLNALTEASVYAADQLFATLDPTTRRLQILDGDQRQTILLTDTVGFIQDLPPALLDAFRATLEEVSEADALLHLVDLSHPAWQRQVAAVGEILGELPIVPGPALLVFNKIDAAETEAIAQARQKYPQAAFICASQRLGLDTLRQRLLAMAGYDTVSQPLVSQPFASPQDSGSSGDT